MFTIKEDAPVNQSTDGFFYDLFEGGYIKPEDYIEDPIELAKLKVGILYVQEFQEAMEKAGKLEEL